MKYVALLSGGKDSCFNLVHCQKNGHELVAAASLRPEQGKEELDSYMYQTVGQDAIEFVARALEVPLYRRVITGTAVEQGLEYGTRTSRNGVVGDETEDLYDLLSAVKSRHPEIQGVSVGAILSNYQRVRVEHVCRRLALTSLSYLWQRRQDELLSEMIDAGLEAVLIKVAGIGLTAKHLGKTLAEMKPTLLKLNDLYGSHVCGEGGEYESLTLDCPLFKSRIVLTDVETVIHSDNGFASVAFMRIKSARLEPKTDTDALSDARVPPLLDGDFQDICESIAQHRTPSNEESSSPAQHQEGAFEWPMSSKRCGKWIAVANVQADVSKDMSVEDEVTMCFQLLQDRLQSCGASLSSIANINIFLSSMDLFARVNAVYSTFFGTSPPTRACVALDLPSSIRVRLDCIAFFPNNPSDSNHPTSERIALHVQSQSYWAPANIGPYSQAIIIDERVFISGQIGLIPSSVTLPAPSSLSIETALSMQHVHRVVEVLENGWRGHTQMAIYWMRDASYLSSVKEGANMCDNSAVRLFVVAKSLPKDAMVEKQVLVHTGRAWFPDDPLDDEERGSELVLRPVEPMFEQGEFAQDDDFVHWEISRLCDVADSTGCALICIRFGDLVKGNWSALQTGLKSVKALEPCWRNTLSIRLFHSVARSDNRLKMIVQGLFSGLYDANEAVPPVTVIPSRVISTRNEDAYDVSLVIIVS